MLTLEIVSPESFDETKQEFIIEQHIATLTLEHSLVSLSKWESKWEIPFLGGATQTTEQALDYIRCMDKASDTSELVYSHISDTNIEAVSAYIDSKMTATWFTDRPATPGRKEVITAEVIYHWMIALSIPFECQDWHLNRLITLIKVCNQKNSPPKKRSQADMIAERNALNAARQKQYNTKG